MKYEIVVVGGGPAGLSAAIQARQRGKSALVVSTEMGNSPLWKAERVDNYLGLPQISGREMLERFTAHAKEQGVEFLTGRVLNILPIGEGFFIGVGSDVVEAWAVVLAPGVARGVKFPGEEAWLGRGVSYCATCDGMLYRGKNVVVVGLSTEAPEEAAYLSGIGCHVTYVSPKRPESLAAEIAYERGVKLEITGDSGVSAVVADGKDLPCEGVFILRAALAPTDLLSGLTLKNAFVAVDADMATGIPGVFAAGDCVGLPLQVSKAVGEGQVAGHRAAEYVNQHG